MRENRWEGRKGRFKKGKMRKKNERGDSIGYWVLAFVHMWLAGLLESAMSQYPIFNIYGNLIAHMLRRDEEGRGRL